MTRQLDLVNRLVADGKTEFAFQDAVTALGASPTSTANLLQRLVANGVVDRVVHGRYIVRPIGSLGTTVASEALAVAVGVAFAGRSHRIAYRSALAELGLLQHPVRDIFVATDRQVRFRAVDGRRLRMIIERQETIGLEAEVVGRSSRSNVSRALFECAMRVDLAGGPQRLAEAMMAAGGIDRDAVVRLVAAFGPRGDAAARRLGSLAAVLRLNLGFGTLGNDRPVIRLDLGNDHVAWVDRQTNVAWGISADELLAAIAN